jgi:uncharacterized protein YodC (DUF2158 family)
MENVIGLPKDEPYPFAIGDVVVLKSGGVQVTVKKMSRVKNAVQVEVDWMDAADTLCSAIFDARQLKAHEESSDG